MLAYLAVVCNSYGGIIMLALPELDFDTLDEEAGTVDDELADTLESSKAELSLAECVLLDASVETLTLAACFRVGLVFSWWDDCMS